MKSPPQQQSSALESSPEHIEMISEIEEKKNDPTSPEGDTMLDDKYFTGGGMDQDEGDEISASSSQ